MHSLPRCPVMSPRRHLASRHPRPLPPMPPDLDIIIFVHQASPVSLSAAAQDGDGAEPSLPPIAVVVPRQPLLANSTRSRAVTLFVPPGADLFRRRHPTTLRMNRVKR